MNRPRLRRSAALVALALVALSFANAPIVTGATASTTYRPNHLAHFDAGTYTGYKFNASGGIVAAKTATLVRPSSASTRLRTTVVAHRGNWLLMVNGIWAGFYVRESNRTYLPFTLLRAVAFAAGTHTGYKFNAAGTVIAHQTYTLGRASSARRSAAAPASEACWGSPSTHRSPATCAYSPITRTPTATSSWRSTRPMRHGPAPLPAPSGSSCRSTIRPTPITTAAGSASGRM